MARVRKLYPNGWAVVLDEAECLACHDRALKWMEYKGNEANLFGGGLESKEVGIKGELALKLLLEDQGVDFEYGGRDGEADDWDFKIAGKVYSLKTRRTNKLLNKRDLVWVNSHQARVHEPDYFVFAACYKNNPEVIILGEIEREKFLEVAKEVKAGERNKFGWAPVADMMQLRVGRLKEMFTEGLK